MKERSKSGLHIGGLHWRKMAHRLVERWSRDQLTNQAAQFSYYFLLAVFPLLLFLTALFGLFVVPGSVQHRAISESLGAVLPNMASGLIDSTLQDISKGSGAGKLSFGLLFAIWSASSGMGAVIQGLNVAYDTRDTRPWWREKLLSIVLTAVVAFLVVVALLLVVSGNDLFSALARKFGWRRDLAVVWVVAQWCLLIVFVLVAFGLMYYFAPNLPHGRLRRLVPGPVLGVGIWLMVSLIFRYYVRHFGNYGVTYGAIGAIIVLMLWFYLTSLAILIGAEVNSILEHEIENSGLAEPDQE
jgi:membrane protein